MMLVCLSLSGVGGVATPSNSTRPETRAPSLSVTTTLLMSASATCTGRVAHNDGSVDGTLPSGRSDVLSAPDGPTVVTDTIGPNGSGTLTALSTYDPGEMPRNVN